MPDRGIGSLWTVHGLAGARILVLAGPFAASRGVPEYVVAPVYTEQEPGFRQTDEDVRLEPAETGFSHPIFAAIWNARPVLEEDLLVQVGLLPDEVIAETRDIYWASLNEERLRSARLGLRVRSRREPVLGFQLRELERWAEISARVMQRAEQPALSLKALAVELDTLVVTMGAGRVALDRDNLFMALAANPETLHYEGLIGGPVIYPLIAASHLPMSSIVGGAFWLAGVDTVEMSASVRVDRPAPSPAAANADYALAA